MNNRSYLIGVCGCLCYNDHWQQLNHHMNWPPHHVYSHINLWTLLQLVLVFLESNMLEKTPAQGCIFHLMQWQVTLLTMFPKTTSQKVIRRGSKSPTVHTEASACRKQRAGAATWTETLPTHPEVVVGVLLCRSVCLFGAASLSFCLLLFVPSPHFSGLRSYCCPNNPSSLKDQKKGGKGVWGGSRKEEEEGVVEVERRRKGVCAERGKINR